MGLEFRQYQEQANQSAIYPSQAEIYYPALGLAGEAGEVCEKIKKWIRDNEIGIGETVYDKKALPLKEIEKELGDVLWYVAALATDLGLDLGTIATNNLLKLESRKERGVLSGSGDNR